MAHLNHIVWGHNKLYRKRDTTDPGNTHCLAPIYQQGLELSVLLVRHLSCIGARWRMRLSGERGDYVEDTSAFHRKSKCMHQKLIN